MHLIKYFVIHKNSYTFTLQRNNLFFKFRYQKTIELCQTQRKNMTK